METGKGGEWGMCGCVGTGGSVGINDLSSFDPNRFWILAGEGTKDLGHGACSLGESMKVPLSLYFSVSLVISNLPDIVLS